MLRGAQRSQTRGDTIIEVLLAITVLSMVAVGGLTVMNQGTATAQRALEISLVRNEIDAQAETIRFLYDSYVAALLAGQPTSTGASGQWLQIVDSAGTNATPFGLLNADGRTCQFGSNAFVVSPRTGRKNASSVTVPTFTNMTFAQVEALVGDVTAARGIWVEAVEEAVDGDTPGYYDFHIRACWDAPGNNAPMTLGTIIRLYTPGENDILGSVGGGTPTVFSHTLTWAVYPSGAQYDLSYRRAGGSWTYVTGLTTNSHTLTGLAAGTYEAQLEIFWPGGNDNIVLPNFTVGP